MDVERWDAWLERAILGLVLSALGFAILAFGGVRIREFLIVEALVGFAAVVWLIRIWTVRSHRLLWPPVCWGVVLFAGWAAWRALDADLPYTAWGEFMRVLTYTTLFFVVLNNLHRQNSALLLVWGLVGLATLLCFYGAFQFATSHNAVWGFDRGGGYLHRASGSYICPNHFAGLLELLVPVALATVIAGRMKPLGRILGGYAVLAMLAGLGLTLSRGGWIAGGVGLAVVLWSLSRNRDYRIPAFACLALLLIGSSFVAFRASAMRHRIRTAGDLNPEARNTRPMIWRAALAMWSDHKVLGVGPAHFAERFKQYRTNSVHLEPERAHNDYIDALADWGVAGVAVAALPLVLLGWGVRRTLQQVKRDSGDIEVKRSTRYAFVLGATAGLAGLGVHSFTDFNLHIPANALVVALWMALLAGFSRYATDDWWASSRRPWRIAITVVLLALLTPLGWDLARRGRETTHLVRAERAADGSPERIEALQAAWAIEPRNPTTAFGLGEAYRLRSFVGGDGHVELAQQALEWFRRAAALHPFDPVHRHRAGMCLDWIGRHDEATGEFEAAVKVDPEGRITSFYMGWHELQRGNDAGAREWFVKSIRQGYPGYEPAERYLRLLDERKPTGAAPSRP